MLLIWAVLAAALLPPTSQNCFKANESQCRNVDFAPGSNLAGEGFDITTMQRKGAFVIDMSSWIQKDKSCTLCKNPYMGGQMQKLPVSVVDWRPSQKCNIKLYSSVYQSSEALVNASTSSIENNWQSDLQLISPKDQQSKILAGSHSKLAKYSMEKTKEDKFIFTRHGVSCGYYGYGVSSLSLLHPELINEFESLPKTYDESTKHLYYKLIDKFETEHTASPAMLQTLLIWAVVADFLPPPTSQTCFKANESQCRNVDFAPGSNLAGEGFDITTMQRKGAFVIDMSSWIQNNSCTLCKNPYMGGQMQKLPVSVVDWRPSQKCKMKVSSSVYQSSEALVSSSTSSIENNWQSDLHIVTPIVQGSLMMAGSHSKLAEYSMEKTKKDKFSFTSHAVSCGYYGYRVSSRPLLHPELINEFGSLPKTYDQSTKHLYYKLIDKFGTHYITKASVSMGIAANLQTEAHHCKQAKDKILNKKSFSSSFSDRETDVIGGYTQSVDLLFSSNNDPKAYKEWVSSLPAHPDVLSYSLEPLHQLLPEKKPIQVHLRKAIKDYILQRALLKNCTSPCKTGVKTNPEEPCRCTCHNNLGMALNCCPTQRGFAQVTITVIKATGLFGDYVTQTDAFVKILLNGQINRGQTSVIPDNNSPTWDLDFHLGTLDITHFSSVKLEVWDEDSDSDDDLLGACNVPLKSEVEKNTCALNNGVLYYEVQVKCIPGLAGPSCTEYKPSPMEAQLEKLYVSQNARPIPGSILLEMGVLLEERIPRFNHSNIFKVKGLEL